MAQNKVQVDHGVSVVEQGIRNLLGASRVSRNRRERRVIAEPVAVEGADSRGNVVVASGVPLAAAFGFRLKA